MKRLQLILIFIFLTGAPQLVKGQYTGPGSEVKLMTVKEVEGAALKLDRKDTQVKLKGFIIEKLNDENYTFSDATGKIKVEIDKKSLPSFPFNEETELIIIGEVDYDLLEGTEIEVERVMLPESETKPVQ